MTMHALTVARYVDGALVEKATTRHQTATRARTAVRRAMERLCVGAEIRGKTRSRATDRWRDLPRHQARHIWRDTYHSWPVRLTLRVRRPIIKAGMARATEETRLTVEPLPIDGWPIWEPFTAQAR
jgi:hypothetical protein